jgi:hypothetical protein
MIVRFDSKAGQLFMNGEPAVQLLRMMGQTGDVPGAILGPDIPPALDRLRRAVEAGTPAAPSASGAEEVEERALPVSLRQRAFPLIELLERAANKRANVVWEKA